MVKVVVFNQQKHDLGNFLTDPCKTLALEWRGKKKKRKIGGQDQVFIFLWAPTRAGQRGHGNEEKCPVSDGI